MKTLQLEINSRAINDTSRALIGTGLIITPPIDENFWLFRVRLSENQAIVGFPKFSVIGVGFAVETDWNTNLPSGCPTEEIWEHIKHNKGDRAIKREWSVTAIRMVQKAALDLKKREFIDALTKPGLSETDKLRLVSGYLRQTGQYEVAQTFDKNL